MPHEFMLYVFEDPDYPKDKPHAVAKVKCAHCRAVYVIVVPAPADHEPFECPECHKQTRWHAMTMKGEVIG